ncbi:MAG: hypothetical protein EpisKO_06630 [Epibacterium sp.]
MWQTEGLDFALPDIEGVEYLLDIMAPEALGWCSFDGMGGAQAHSWLEIQSLSQMADLQLEPWEAKAIRSMSVAYVQGYTSGRDPMTVSPAYRERPEEDPGLAAERRRISESLSAGLSSMVG